ncbi:tripartite tricarboxylate transporter TctB family protein [Aureimonas sp. ME7]|uniref:tripartite tricarboxylate transporter TctB family protein n=1 Tax=Aureimonas sp. ME7 TaxID=2744252 RepID=UPI0015F36CB5|nr:tripartite tricarboxylate transporter TctB family protein [Aureimonas sp. ME7]
MAFPAHALVRKPRNLVGGLLLVGLAAGALRLSAQLDQGTLGAIGPGMFPRWLAFCLGLCGLAVAASALKEGDPSGADGLEAIGVRGPALVLLAIASFALTLRPFELGPFSTPGGGLLVAGPLTVFLGGLATPEARPRELLAIGAGLTAFSIVLFADLLNLPIPVYPQALADALFAGWSHKTVLRVLAALLALIAAVLVVLGERAPTEADRG